MVEAWNELATCRTETGARIPWTAINDYADAHGITDVARFKWLVRAMENASFQLHSRKEGVKSA